MTADLEDRGAAVILPEAIEKQLQAAKIKVKEDELIMRKQAYRALDLWDYDPAELLDSTVPACCKYGCVVEPDGYCEHGQPSILLNHDMI